MTHPTLSERAVALRAAGKGYREIAAELGVGIGTAYRWCNPDVEDEYRSTSRAWKKRNPSRCEVCGAEKAHDPSAPRCLGCVEAIADVRASLLVGMFEDGWTYAEMARALGYKNDHVGTDLARLRRAGLIGYRQPDHWNAAA